MLVLGSPFEVLEKMQGQTLRANTIFHSIRVKLGSGSGSVASIFKTLKCEHDIDISVV